ncbi:hypothetical protein Patl1_17821 [Pistacia atlantica]|uniref:Uncharacterized protein n=1 Tax=Pistacia atlantica TaxID=434234 RepID=A0ACC1C3Q3_9ROSI|nr:hypothetical protein Patl1_17821 [Pistacia atlantica]
MSLHRDNVGKDKGCFGNLFLLRQNLRLYRVLQETLGYFKVAGANQLALGHPGLELSRGSFHKASTGVWVGKCNTPASRRIFEVERDRLINNDASKSTIEAMLSTMSIPVKASLVDEILIYVKEMTDDNLYTSLDINMGFFVDTPVEILPRDYGVTDPSVLEIVKVEASKEPSICIICLEEVVFGSLATRMPCSHVFHSDCIGNWLNERQVCPLCRFQLK